MLRHTHVFFDLDGTLTDSAPGILNSCEYALSKLGVRMERGAMYAFIGPPLLDTFTKVLESEEKGREALRLYREYFAGKGIFENSVYPGVRQMLERLRDAGAQLVLATAKPEPFARRIMDHFDLARHFVHLGGADMDGPVRSKRQVIERNLATVSASPGATLMVGDRREDVDSANRLGLSTAAALWGYAGPGEVDHADFLCATPDEVTNVVLAKAGP